MTGRPWARGCSETLADIEANHRERVELLRTVGEHPSPIFAGFVKRWGMFGLEKPMVARLLNIPLWTLRTHYDDDYEMGRAELILSVGANMARISTSLTDPNAGKVGMELLARRGGEPWRPPLTRVADVPDPDKAAPVIDSSKFTYDERQKIRAALERIQAGGEGEPLRDDEPSVDG